MQIFFIVQNLSQISDSVGFDCIFQYKTLCNHLGIENVHLFADVFDKSIHQDIDIRPFSEFESRYLEAPDAIVIYHFCDGWGGVDELLAAGDRLCILRWHNNTVPWFYALDNLDFAAGCLRGFQTVSALAKSPAVRFHVNSEFTARQLVALDGLPSRTSVVYPASPLLSRGDMRPNRSLIETGDNDRPIKLLFVSRIVPHKGHKHVVSVASVVQRFLGRPTEVMFVGSVEERLKQYRADLQDMAQRLDVNVVFTGTVSDERLLTIYNAADVFICLSEHEGFGMPVFEAMRCHVPVVAWAACALRDLLQSHPLASPEFNIFRFAAATILALQSNVREAVEPLQRDILAGYTSQVVVDQLLAALNESCGVVANSTPAAPPRRVGRIAEVDRLVDELSADLERRFGSSVEIADHDSPLNLMGRYDIAIYDRLLTFLRKEKGFTGSHAKLGSGDLVELHPYADVVKPLMDGAPASALTPCRDLQLLLRFDDEIFVKNAYVAALGRDADLPGLRYSLRRIRQGFDKIALLRELIGSEEGRRAGFVIVGLAPVDKPAPALPPPPLAPPVKRGWLSRAPQPAPAPAPAPENQLRAPDGPRDPGFQNVAACVERLGDAVGRLSRYLVPDLGELPPGHPLRSIHHVDELLQLNDDAFVKAAFWIILGRSGDQGGIDHYRDALRHGMTRRAFLLDLSHSDEGKAFEADLDGLGEVLADNRPGGHDGDQQVAASRTVEQRLAKVENDLGRLVQTLMGLPGQGGVEPSRPAARETILRLRPRSLIHVSERLPEAFERLGYRDPVDADDASQSETIEFIHQIYISDIAMTEEMMPPLVRANVESVRHFHPQAKYRLWSGPDLRRFIAKHFSAEVVDAFDTLAAYALKADLARYCLLYIYGGLYSDLSNRFLNQFRIGSGKNIAYFREHKPLHGAVWMSQNTIIFAKPRQPEIKLAIDLVLENVRTLDYGVSSLAPTGPVLFGRAFAAIGRSQQYQLGESLNLQVEGMLNRSCYFGDGGTLVAVRLQGGGGKPTDIGLSGTNSYGQLWDERRIYSEWEKFYAFDNPAVHSTIDKSRDGIRIEPDARGTHIFGPYVALERGRYSAIAVFAERSFQGKFTLDICGRSGHAIVAEMHDAMPDASGRVTLSFALSELCDDIEVRIQSAGSFSGTFLGVTIRRDGRLRDGAPEGGANLLVAPSLIAGQPEPGDEVRFIHQIVDRRREAGEHDLLTPEQAYNADLLRSMHSKAEYNLWTIESLRDFIKTTFPLEVTLAFDRLQLSALKADLGRYCLLLATGGLVVDPNIRFVLPLTLMPGRELVCFRNARTQGDASWAVSTDVLFSIPDQAEFQEAIDTVLANVRTGYHGCDVTSPAGGEMLGRVLAISYRAAQYQAGEITALSNGTVVSNDCYLGMDGRLQAVRLAGPESESRQAARSAWLRRSIYNEPLVRR